MGEEKNKPMLAPFHLAIPVDNLEKCRTFYREIIGCSEGRSSNKWVDFNFYGHQLVLHEAPVTKKVSNPVDGHEVPIPHFGLVMPMNDWETLAEKLKTNNISFIIDPCIRFKGKTGEQATMFFLDPSRNAIEFKAFKNIDQLFTKE